MMRQVDNHVVSVRSPIAGRFGFWNRNFSTLAQQLA